MLKKLTTLIVYVGDMERSVPFYRDVLGLPLQAESPGTCPSSRASTSA